MTKECKILSDALELIHDISIDYDGFRSAKDLKSLIDELREIANNALKGKPVEWIYIKGKEKEGPDGI